jgi:hypothetical protein
MRTSLLFAVLIAISSASAVAQTARTVISSGGGKNFTVGQNFVSYSKGNPNRLWQGFWLPKQVPVGVTDFTPLIPFSKIYPNPASTQITVESQSLISTVSIFDSRGNFVKSFDGNTSSVNDLATGIYAIQVKTMDGKVENQRLVIYR